MVKYIGRGLVVKRPGALSKVQMLTLVLGVGVFSLLPHLESRSPNRKNFPSNRCLGQLKSHFQIARFVIRASVQIAVRIAMPISLQEVRTMSFSEKVHTVLNR